MSRSGDERGGRLTAPASGRTGRPGPPRRSVSLGVRHALAAVALSVSLGLFPAPALGQATVAPGSSAPTLTPEVQRSLLRLQEEWLQWTSAFYVDDEKRANAVVDDLLATTERLGMRGLPDLAAGALVQAVEAARKGDADSAALALATAGRLDPGRPETAFAAAEVAGLEKRYAAMLVEYAKGYARLPDLLLARRLVLHDLLLWTLASLLLSGGLFLALEMVVRGPTLLRALSGWIGEHLFSGPAPLVVAVAMVVLLWPLVLPFGLLWVVLYWSVLLWSYASGGERVVLALLWLLTGLAPITVSAVREQVALSLSPPVRAMESVAEGRLYGGLFTDLGVLAAVLPGEPAVRHFMADLHARLGQGNEARRLYEEVLEAEPHNSAAMVDLGAYYFNRGDYGNAVSLFQQAAALMPQSAVPQFDLSLAYAESYLYDEQHQALQEARRIDDLRVTRWLSRPERQRVVTVNGGIARIGEIRNLLRAEWSGTRGEATEAPALALLRRIRPLILVLLLAVAAIVLQLTVGRAAGRRSDPADEASRAPGSGGTLGILSAILLPGLPSARRGRPLRAYLALLLPTALALGLLGAFGHVGYSLPWRYDPGGRFLGLAVLSAFAVLLVVRVANALKGRA